MYKGCNREKTLLIFYNEIYSYIGDYCRNLILFSKAPKNFLIHVKGLTKYIDALSASAFVNMAMQIILRLLRNKKYLD